jgi:hypothetical protein
VALDRGWPRPRQFELLADLDTEPAGSTVHFDACDNLGAVNLRGTGFASRDVVQQHLTAEIGGNLFTVEVNVTGLAGFLLAKSAAAYSRRKLRAGTTSPSYCSTTNMAERFRRQRRCLVRRYG